jgi:hypothetical protein
VAFDQSGAVRWIVPNDQPQIATEDGGVIGQSGVTYDQNGSAKGQMASQATQSWLGYVYTDGPVEEWVALIVKVASGWWTSRRANNSANNSGVNSDYIQLDSCKDATLHSPPACPAAKGCHLLPAGIG